MMCWNNRLGNHRRAVTYIDHLRLSRLAQRRDWHRRWTSQVLLMLESRGRSLRDGCKSSLPMNDQFLFQFQSADGTINVLDHKLVWSLLGQVAAADEAAVPYVMDGHLALLQETHSFSSQLLGSRTVVLEARSEICLGVSKGSSLSRRSLSKEDCLNIMVDGLQESKVRRVFLEARHGRGPSCLVASWGGGALSLSAPGTYSNWIFESSQPLELWE